MALALALANGAVAQPPADAEFGLRLRPDTAQPGAGAESVRAPGATPVLVPLSA